MMHKFLQGVLLASLLSVPAMAQQKEPVKARLSPLTRLYLQQAAQLKAGERVPNYIYKTTADQKVYISAIIKVKPTVDTKAITALGVLTGTKAGNIWTVQIPIAQVQAFTQIPDIDYIQLDEPVNSHMDSVRKATRVDSVHSGINLPMPYNGENVVVGVVDAGFDYTNPALFDTTGTGYRVKRIWEQKISGTPPAGFSYGNELTDSAAMWARQTDLATGSHGAHVTGIVAGSGVGGAPNNSGAFRGVAYKSDLVLVGITPAPSQWYNTGISDMIDGMNYVYTYAASVGKPAVVNLSWGSPAGPHDGSSLFSQACDNLTGAGKIFVCSGGNNGDNNIHVQKTFTNTDSTVYTFLNIADVPDGKKTWVDIWGDTAKTFCVQVRLFNGNNAIDSTGYICLDNNLHNTYLIGSNNDTCFVEFVTADAEFNDKPRVFLRFNSKVPDDICIGIKGKDGKVNMWNSYVYETAGYYGSFSNGGKPWAVSGNTEMTISDISSTRSAIAVGAYASKISFTNLSGGNISYQGYATKGALVPFSSKGPTADNRIKPDIAGPGMTVASSVNAFDVSVTPGGADEDMLVSSYTHPTNGHTYYYAMFSGTSMSGPAVSGIVAMMLQLKPNLTPASALDIIRTTAIKDIYTTQLPQGPNNRWGSGKINAYGAVKKLVQMTGVTTVVKHKLDCNIFPNPNNGSFTIDYLGKQGPVQVEIYDAAGHVLLSELWETGNGMNRKQYDVLRSAKGVYFARITAGEAYNITKMVIQ